MAFYQQPKSVDSDEMTPRSPRMLTQRELLEDIENIKDDDPVLQMANLVANKTNDIPASHDLDAEFKEFIKLIGSNEVNLDSTLVEQSGHCGLENFPSLDLQKTFTSYEEPSSPGIGLQKVENFLTACEHSQRLIDSIDVNMKKLVTKFSELSVSVPNSNSNITYTNTSFSDNVPADSESNLL